MAQYSTPQFIEAEGKIIPILTFRQFFILVGAGAIGLALHYTLPYNVFLPLALIDAVLAGTIAFVKINDVGIVTFTLYVVGFAIKSKNYVWTRNGYSPATQKEAESKTAQETVNNPKSTKDIVEYRKK